MTVDTTTGEIVQISHADVRESIATTITHLEKAAEQVVWQIQNRVWTVIGYADWDEMREAEYHGAAVIVPRADRPELVSRLRHEGLSQQQVGETLGVDQATVARDEMQMHNVPPGRTDSLGREQPTRKPRPESEIVDAELVDEPEPPQLTAEERERYDEIAAARNRQAQHESELRAARANLRSVLTHLISESVHPGALAATYAEAAAEFNPDHLHFAARTMTAIANRRSR